MPVTLSEGQVRWVLYGGPTISVASRSAALRPSIGQAIGCCLAAGSSQVRFFMLASRNRGVITDLRAGHEVAVVMTRSSTTRSLQIKGSSAKEVPLTDEDRARAEEYVETVVREWAQDGTPPAFTRALMVTGPGPIVAFEMEMTAAFDQTPGPRAGEALRGEVPQDEPGQGQPGQGEPRPARS